MSVVYLFGIHLSGFQPLIAHESVFLSRAIQNTQVMPQPNQILHDIQAQVLLSHYFLRQGRFLEAMHRINTAVSLCIGCGIHKQQATPGSTSAFYLAPARDSVEQGERIDALWTTLALHKCWGLVLHWPSAITTILEEDVDTPWPLEMNAYESVSHLLMHRCLN